MQPSSSEKDNFFKNSFTRFLIKFIGTYCILYYGTQAYIGLTAPGGYYVEFLDIYLNYIDWLRKSILFSSGQVVSILGYKNFLESDYVIRLSAGNGVQIIYSCLGTAVMSFWAAFVFANPSKWQTKALWIFIGWLAIWLINVTRIAVILLAQKEYNINPLGIDHHTWFNMAAYVCVILLVVVYHKMMKRRERIIDVEKV